MNAEHEEIQQLKQGHTSSDQVRLPAHFIFCFLWLFLLGCTTSAPQTAVSQDPFIIPTATPQPTTAVIIASILTEGTLEPTTTPASEPTKTPLPPTPTPDIASDLRLGATPDLPHCEWLTEEVAQILRDNLNLQVTILTFSADEALFAALAGTQPGTADLTLCYRDPKHRFVLQDYFGFVSFIGGSYWTDGEDKQQILAKTAVVARLQATHPCAYTFLQTLTLPSTALATQTFSNTPPPCLNAHEP